MFAADPAANSPATSTPTPLPAPPSVGLEGRLTTHLPGALLSARPVDPRSPLLLRVAEARPHGTETAYDFRYVGLEPGRYDLRDYLLRPDGTRPADLPPLPVEVVSVLPRRHDGQVLPTEPPPGPRLGGYRILLVALGTLWVLLLVPLLLRSRPATPPTNSGPPPEPSLADRLRPLLARAAAGELDVDGKARLERLLLGHWRERLKLEDVPLAESVTRLREHPEGGAILRALERWLHQRPGPAPVDLEPLLAPYRNPPGSTITDPVAGAVPPPRR